MNPDAQETSRILASLTDAPLRIEQITRDLPPERLYLRSEAEPWSINDILAHLRANADVWGKSIIAMLTRDHPTLRYVSPRGWMKKPIYQEQEFFAALELFTHERQKLVKTLAALDEIGWQRGATFTGTSERGREQTVFSYANRMISHEQAHLTQIEGLLR